MKYIQFCATMLWFLLLNAKPESQWQILNKNISQNFSISMLFLEGVLKTTPLGSDLDDLDLDPMVYMSVVGYSK
jgi:hypothetical protein